MEWLNELSEVVRNFAIVAGGVFGLWLAWSRTRALNQQTEIASEQASVDRRQKALELYREFCGDLGSDDRYTQNAAVQGLVELAVAYPDLLEDPVVRILVTRRSDLEKVSPELFSLIDPALEKWRAYETEGDAR